MNTEWAIERLTRFLTLSDAEYQEGQGRWRYMHSQDLVLADAQVVEQILDAVLGAWDHDHGGMYDPPWKGHREATVRAIAQLEQQEEIEANLGEAAPNLSAANLHPWVWDSCRTLWSTGHHHEAIGAAARAVNAAAQQKLDRRDLSEWKLLAKALQTKPGSQDDPRLRLTDDDGSDTYTSLQEGAALFAQGAYRALRNPVSHEQDVELPEHIALERLAVFSVLARWIDQATVTRD